MPAQSALSRRQVLAGSGLAVVGVAAAGAAGALGGAFTRPPSRVDGTGRPAAPSSGAPAPTPETSELNAALAREHMLLAGIDLALQANPGQGGLSALRADHEAHATAIATALGAAGSSIAGSGGSQPSTANTSPGQSVPTTAALRAAEQAAQTAAGAASARSHGADAVLLACIAASEAGHVELLA